MQAHFGSYNRAYGSLAGVIIFLIWMWIYNTAVLIGAEFSAERERGCAVACGLPPDEEPFTELRDTASCLGSEAGRGARPPPTRGESGTGTRSVRGIKGPDETGRWPRQRRGRVARDRLSGTTYGTLRGARSVGHLA